LANVASLYRSSFGGNPFTVGNDTNARQISATNGSSSAVSVGTITVPVACVRLAASLQFTRASTSSGSLTSTKDALCVAEFGAGYRGASLFDVASRYESAFPGIVFTVVDDTNARQVNGTNGSSGTQSVGTISAAVACMSW
jgi:hypothetical protein